MSDAAPQSAAVPTQTGSSTKWVALAVMMFAVSMMFIDQTIVSIAIPTIQTELGLSDAGVQWVVNGYLLSLSAFFALGGRLSDILGTRRWSCLVSRSSRSHRRCVARLPTPASQKPG